MDKMKLVKSMLDTMNGQESNSGKKILQGISKKDKEESTNKDEQSIDQISQGVDFLMDENILTNESREETDSQNMRTPGGIKSLNINSINAINSAGFSNQ